LEQNQISKLSLAEVLESYKNIELTEEEMMEAVLVAKQKKEKLIHEAELIMREDQNRRLLTETRFSYEQTKGLMLYRAEQLFSKRFVLDADNSPVFEMLCYYFSRDEKFIELAENYGVELPTMKKGILLAGNFGVGKSWIMKLFQKNQRQVYYIRYAKEIANEYSLKGEKHKDAEDSLENKFKNPMNDSSVFYHKHSGLCIDDLGTEDIKAHYSNKKNVIGDLIEIRYAKGNTGIFLHASTNLSSSELKEFYGPRVASRMREIFNFIELAGEDRRR